MLKKLWLILSIRCDEASRLQSDAFDRKLALHERLAIRGHVFVCRACRVLGGQLRFLSDASRQAASSKHLASCKLPSEAAQRIKARMSEEATD